jgi:hypothetical protein
MLGGAAGLGGAAAVAHGLALLGGGTLAAGGAGMAGGMWLVATAAAGLGGAMATGTQVAYTMGARQFQTEVIKLQVSLKIKIVENQISVAVAQEKIKQLHIQRTNLEEIVTKERKLNDSNSERLKDLETKLQAITDAMDWLKRNAV